MDQENSNFCLLIRFLFMAFLAVSKSCCRGESRVWGKTHTVWIPSSPKFLLGNFKERSMGVSSYSLLAPFLGPAPASLFLFRYCVRADISC